MKASKGAFLLIILNMALSDFWEYRVFGFDLSYKFVDFTEILVVINFIKRVNLALL